MNSKICLAITFEQQLQIVKVELMLEMHLEVYLRYNKS